MNKTEVTAPAKVNLFLDVGPLRQDGFHDIVSIMQAVDLCDRLTIEILNQDSPQIHLTANDTSIPVGPENTLCKAYQAFVACYPDTPAVSVHLEKNIPSQAGLGGGSSDAASLIRFLANSFAPDATPENLIAIAAKVGSDVPFFLGSTTALVEGRGDKISAISCLPSMPILLLHPTASMSTAVAYRSLDAIPDRAHPSVNPMIEAIENKHMNRVIDLLHNSFELCVFDIIPKLSCLHRFCLDRLGKGVLLSGSGSNLFVLSESSNLLLELQTELNQVFSSVKSTLTQTLEGS